MRQNELEIRLKPVINDLGYDLWGCEYVPQGKHSLLRIYIDKAEGIRIEDCECVSKQVGAILDVEALITGNYSLEISSPGIPRPLFYKEHYQRYQGNMVKIKLYRPINMQRNLTGTIMDVGDDFIRLNVGDENNLEVQFSQIVKANLIDE